MLAYHKSINCAMGAAILGQKILTEQIPAPKVLPVYEQGAKS